MMTDYNCPTGNCSQAKPCQKVSIGDAIDPNSIEHLERNACNSCPITPPKPLYRNIREKVDDLWGQRWIEKKLLIGYFDHLGNRWKPDNAVTAWWFHDDPFPGTRDHENMTFRVYPDGEIRGWQCRYENGVLDDSSKYMGTYDYADAPSSDHWDMDVAPHNTNDNYSPNLTNKY